MNKRYTIIPDVHGRQFWRAAVQDVPEVPVIFLGDYLDPYPQDFVTWDEAWQGLQDILALKRAHPKEVTLLLGNHDVHYFKEYPFMRAGTRYDSVHHWQIRRLFEQNLELFDMAVAIPRRDGRPFLLTHAGVTDYWVNEVVSFIERNVPNLFSFAEALAEAGRDPVVLALFLNETLHTEDKKLFKYFIWTLSSISSSRGGRDVGSPVWADVDDICRWDRRPLKDCIQVVGHTRQDSFVRIFANRYPPKNVYCIDYGRAFTLEEGAESFLRLKMERMNHFSYSDFSCAPRCFIFGTWIWNLGHAALEEARRLLDDMVARRQLYVHEEGAYYLKSFFMEGDPPRPYDWVVENYEAIRPEIMNLEPGQPYERLIDLGTDQYLFEDPSAEEEDD